MNVALAVGCDRLSPPVRGPAHAGAGVRRPCVQALHAHPVRNRAWEDVTTTASHDRRPRVRRRPEVVAALRREPRVLQRRRGRAGRLSGPHLRPVVIHPEQTGEWLAHPEGVARRSRIRPTPADREPDPRLRLRLPDPRRRRHVGAHVRQRLRQGRLPGIGEILTDSTTPRSRAPHHRRGLHRRRDARLDGNKERGPVPVEVNEDGDPTSPTTARRGSTSRRRSASSTRRSSTRATRCRSARAAGS